jgi:LysM repeat protein
VEFCDVEPTERKPACRWRQTAVVEICAQVTQSQELAFITSVQEIAAPPETGPEADSDTDSASDAASGTDTAPGDCPPGTTFSYTVAAGDTMYKIARAHNVSVNAVIRANPGISSRNLRIGQVIQVPCPGGLG